MKIKIIAPGVTDHNAMVEVGQEVEYDDANAKRLIETGYAEAVEAVEAGKADDLTATPDGTENGDNGNGDNGGTDTTAVRTALDKKYKAPELLIAAKEAGVDVPNGATKADIITAVIEAGKADGLLV